MKRLPISPLRENPTWLDRIEFALQWCLHLFVYTDDKHPCLAGMLTTSILWGTVLITLILLKVVHWW
jgi:hypothetical protein